MSSSFKGCLPQEKREFRCDWAGGSNYAQDGRAPGTAESGLAKQPAVVLGRLRERRWPKQRTTPVVMNGSNSIQQCRSLSKRAGERVFKYACGFSVWRSLSRQWDSAEALV
ncbi:hypothetical protein NPIL_300881 [Nephila pilipes]|uniref:Uncharacterized protein n=1 Tax=Nephila pilipes TaxID=299642 RepID=A0A8X6NIZ4_NEPPI|nr:hypothetical protein NPIL_300881 [Nephila pilipes]